MKYLDFRNFNVQYAVIVRNSNKIHALMTLAGGGELPGQLPCHCQQHTV